VATGFGLWLWGRRRDGLPAGLPGGWTGGALLALLGLYLLQFAWAVYPRGNLDTALRVAAGFMAYLMVRAEAGPNVRRRLGWAFVLSAAGLGVLGFLEYTGYLFRDPDLARALSLVGLNTRMFTTLQYPNTAAVYFLAAGLAAVGLGLDDLKPWKLAVTGALTALEVVAFFFTISRGAVVVLPFGLLLFYAGLQRNRLWPATLMLLAGALPLLLVMKPVGAAAAAQQTRIAFQWLAAAVAGGAATGLLVALFLRLKERVQAAAAGAVVVLAVAGALLLRPAGGFLPKQAERLLDVNFRTVNVVLRLIYDQDALKLAADRPLGRGGWGWDRSYRQVQQFNYTARETHNQYAQTAVEAGWAGLVALVGALGAALWAAWRARRENPLGWSLAAAGGLIAAHSAIDFNLSFGVVWLLLWTLLAAAAEPLPTPADTPAPRAEGWKAAGAWLLAGVVAVTSGLLAVGATFADRAGALAATEPAAAKAAARQAMRFDPLFAEPLMILGDVPSLERAARLDPNHSGIRFQLAVALELQKDYAGALREAKAALEAQPMVSVYYTKVASLSGILMQDAVFDGRRADAEPIARDLVTLGQSFADRKRLGDSLQAHWRAERLTMEPEFKLRYGQALFLTGDKKGAEPLLQEAAKVGLLGSEAEVWLYVLYEQRGDSKAMQALAGQPWIRFRAQNPVYKNLKAWQ
jgi:O-antigen ligase